MAKKAMTTKEAGKSLSGRASISAGEQQPLRNTLLRKVGTVVTSVAEKEVILPPAGEPESVPDKVNATAKGAMRSTLHRRVGTVGTSHKIVLE